MKNTPKVCLTAGDGKSPKRKSSHKNVYLRNFKDLDRYIANDFKHLHLSPKATADYISWLDNNITQRPLLYITHVLVNEVNFILKPYKLTLKISNDGLKLEKLETNSKDMVEQCDTTSENCLPS